MTGPTLLSVPELRGPFGTPDGSRADIDDILRDFVAMDGRPGLGGVATRADDTRVRVIVGRIGAGKTVYMRRLFSFQESNDAVYADRPQQGGVPHTDLIVQACGFLPERILTEKWMQLWHRAILRSLTTHLLTSRELRSTVDPDEAAEIRREYGNLIGEFRRPRSIYSELRDIVNTHNAGERLRSYLENRAWDDLEDALADLLQGAKPVFFYLDAIDDQLNSAPFCWLRCQEGLFEAVMKQLPSSRLGSAVHVVICVRELVLASMYRRDAGSRYYGNPHIRVLDWSRDAIEFLLRQKIERLPPEFLMAPSKPGGPESWLGCSWVHDHTRGVDEDVVAYLIRHTRLIPRDIISLGNDLCQAVLQQKDLDRSEVPVEVLRQVVSLAARRFGDSQLAQCATQIAGDTTPRHAANHGFSELYTSNQEYTTSVREQLKDILRALGVDRFRGSDLQELADLGARTFDSTSEILPVLWQNGLLGFGDRDGTHFYSVSDIHQPDIPEDAEEYVLHPAAAAAVRGMRSARPASATRTSS
jgi:hypothetical protein